MSEFFNPFATGNSGGGGSSGGGGGGINADIVKGVGIDFEGTDPITIKNTGVTSVSESSTNGTINVSNGGKAPVEVPVHGLGSAAYKNVDISVAENSENLITSGAVSQAINELPNPMLFKGSLGTGGTITYLPTATPENEGYTYKVITTGSYSGKTAKVGDVFISNGSEWIIVPSGDESNGTVTSVGISVPTGLKVADGTSPVTTSGTIEVQLDEGYVIPKTVDIVPSTRKINNITLESDVILDGDDIKTTGYAKAESKSNITGTDTINQALGKLELKADTNETNISTLKKHVTGELTDSDFQEDTTAVMIKTVPTGMSNYAAISKIGGKTVKDEENQVLLNAVVESVVSTSADGTNETTLLIPDSIKNLPDYGVEGNYVDFENGTYTHTNTITDGEVTALSTVETIDISDMLLPIRCESGGTITLQNEHSLDVPNTVVYKKEVSLNE